MPKVTCVKCEGEMRPLKNDVAFVETTGPERSPYKIWSADLWGCPLCGVEVVSGFGNKPIAGRWQDDFEERLHSEIKRGPIFYAHEYRGTNEQK